jgi:hypothetical protein
MFNVLGVGLSFILGTYLVRETAETDDTTCTTTVPWAHLRNGTVASEDKESVRMDIERLLYLQTGAAGVLLLLVLIYYPRLHLFSI